jgi:hypothetical protein
MLSRRDQPDAITALSHAATRTIVKHKKISLAYVAGILLLLFFHGVRPSAEQQHAYETSLPPRAELVSLAAAEEAKRSAYHAYMASKGWFTCDAICNARRQEYNAKEATYERLRSSVNEQLTEARSHLGVFSTDAVESARELWWSAFAQGKAMASRMTWYDAMFTGFRAIRRDEEFTSYLVEIALQAIYNFVMSTFMMTITFLWNVVDVIKAYRPGYLLGLVFWVGASLAASSVLLSIVFFLYGAFWTAIIVADPRVAYHLDDENVSRARLRLDRRD